MDFGDSDKLKVLAIAGSPRRKGNTDTLLEKAVEGARSNTDTEIIKIILSELCIAPCRHCDGCLHTGRCVIDDDMQSIHNLLRKADRIILASPIFFMSLGAQTKAMIDRCQALWVLKYVLKLPIAFDSQSKRKGLFLSVGGTGFSNLFEPSLAIIKSFFTVLDISLAGQVTYRKIDAAGDILKHPEALQEAFNAGKALVNEK